MRDAIFFCRLTKDTGVLRPAQKYNIEPENAQDLPSWLTELERRQGFRYTLQVRLPARFSFMVPTPSNAQPFDLFIKLSPHRRGPFPVELPKDPDVWQPRFDPKKPVELVCHIPEWLTSALHVGGPVASGARFIPKVRPLANDPGFLRSKLAVSSHGL